MPATPAPSVWQTAFLPALTCSLASSQGLRPGCSGKQCPDEPAPSLRPRYRSLTATTGRSAGARRDGTQHLAVSAAWCAPSRARIMRAQCQRAPSRVSAREPQTGLAPPARRAPPGQQYGHSARLIPGRALSPRFRCRLLISTLQRWFTRVRLPGPRLTALTPPFPHRSAPQSSARAPCGGLTPPPAGRRRRATKPSSHVQQASVIASYRGATPFRAHGAKCRLACCRGHAAVLAWEGLARRIVAGPSWRMLL